MYTSKEHRRIEKSRDGWKNRSQHENREKRRANQRERYQRQARENEQREAKEKIKRLERELERVSRAPTVQAIPTPVMQVLCLQLVLHLHISFRSVPKILALLCRFFGLMMWIPHYTTIIEWALRIGVHKLKSVGKIAEPWLGIMDFSIQCGKEKVLVVLRLPVSFFAKNKRAPTLSDCETVMVSVKTDWSGTVIVEALKGLVEQCGQPLYWLTDGGSDLGAALKALPKAAGARCRPFRVLDVGHVFANAFRRYAQSRDNFATFLKAISHCSSRIRQTEFGALAAPRIRSKGRFMSIGRVLDWFHSVREYIARQSREKVESRFQSRLSEFFGWTEEYVGIAHDLKEISDISNKILTILKNEGLNRQTWQTVMNILTELPQTNAFRLEVERYLRKTLRIVNLIGGIPIVISDDVIESLFGVVKRFTGEGKTSNFGRLVLCIPSFTDSIDEDTIQEAFSNVNTKEMRQYIHDNIPPSLHQVRKSQLRGRNIRRRRKGKKLAKNR